MMLKFQCVVLLLYLTGAAQLVFGGECDLVEQLSEKINNMEARFDEVMNLVEDLKVRTWDT